MTRPTSTIHAFSPEACADEAGMAARVEGIALPGEPGWVDTNHTGRLRRLPVAIRMKP